MVEDGVTRGRLALLAVGLALLAGCTTPAKVPDPDAPTTPAYYAPAEPAAETAKDDQCGATQLQWLVGRPRTEIPVPLKPEMRRVACSTCPVTMDYNERRQTILFNSDTELVTEVRCG